MFGRFHSPTGHDAEQSAKGSWSALSVKLFRASRFQTLKKPQGEIDKSGSGSAARICRHQVQKLFEGFDPGSERTLAAWIRHASRANPRKGGSGERGSKAWVTYPGDWNSPSREGVIPGDERAGHPVFSK